MRHTKIIATVGPASNSADVLDAMIAGGTDIVRLNFSHGTHAAHEETFKRVRAAALRAGRDVAVLQDLSGPKIRTGPLEGGRPIELKAGEALVIATGTFAGAAGRVSTSFAPLAQSVRPGDRLLLADGAIELRVDGTDGQTIRTTVVDGGPLGERKGIIAPGVALPVSSITPKDVDDLNFGMALGVDMVALSFVKDAADLRRARELTSAAGRAEVPLVAKLERPEALEDLDAILGACDGVMVARGDLGLEIPLEQLPRVQKDITLRARQRQVPVIVATQVLESMTKEPRPTRAEVSDAANAVEDGVDAVMLSGETAVGAFPARAVSTLDAVIRDAESSGPPHRVPRLARSTSDHAQALCEAAVVAAEESGAQGIVAVTRGGDTARRLAALRPRMGIVALTSRDDTARRLALYRGVRALHVQLGNGVDSVWASASRELMARGLAQSGSAVVVVNIHPDLTRRDANYVKIHQL